LAASAYRRQGVIDAGFADAKAFTCQLLPDLLVGESLFVA